MKATLVQAIHILTLIKDKFGEESLERLQQLIDSGLFSDLLEVGDLESLDRRVFRRMLGIQPLPHPKPFQVEVDFRHNTTNLLQQVLWKFQLYCNDFPKADGLYTKQKGKTLCAPREQHSTMGEIIAYWKKRGFGLAGFRETLITAVASKAPAVYVCPIPTPRPAKGPCIIGVDFEYWLIIRDRKGLMYLTTDELSQSTMSNGNDYFVVYAGKTRLHIKKRNVFLVMLNPKDKEK